MTLSLLRLVCSVVEQGGSYRVVANRVIFTDARGNKWDHESRDEWGLWVAASTERLQAA